MFGEKRLFCLAAGGALLILSAEAADPTHGAVAGDVSDTQATIWSRTDANSTMYVSIYECNARVVGEELTDEVDVDSSGDYTGQIDFDGLTADTCYEAEVQFDQSATAVAAYVTFTTAPDPDTMSAVKFAWSSCLGGQNICRDVNQGYPIFNVLSAVEDLDFFLNLGDSIYGDGVCEEEGLGGNTQVVGDFNRSTDLENFWAHWRYQLEDAGYQRFLRNTTHFMIWDDHEVVDDFGPDFDNGESSEYTPGDHLMPIGMQAFQNYNPIRSITDPTQAAVFYRTVRWGKALELFILDTRQYRSLPTEADNNANAKTMLGETQLAWLKESLTNSTAVWKIIATSVPLSIPTGPGDPYRDGWADYDGNTGYENELEEILLFLQDGEMHDVVFITADVHFAQGLRYQPFADDADFELYEIIVGPLNAGLFPETALDDTFAPERLFFYSSESNSLSGTEMYEDIIPFFNFGLAEIDVDGNLVFSVINTESEVVANVTLAPRDFDAAAFTPSPVRSSAGTPSPSNTTAPAATSEGTPSPTPSATPSTTPSPTSVAPVTSDTPSTTTAPVGSGTPAPTEPTSGADTGEDSGAPSMMTDGRHTAGMLLGAAAAAVAIQLFQRQFF